MGDIFGANRPGATNSRETEILQPDIQRPRNTQNIRTVS